MSGKIKILYTIPNFDTAGSGKVVYDLVKGLDKTKFSPEICCHHDGGEFFKEIEKLEVPIHIFRFSVSYRPFISLPFRLLKIAKFFKAHKFDLIHSWHWSSDFTEPLAAKIAGIPFVYTKKAMGWGNRAWLWRTKLSRRIIAINKDMLTQFFGDFKAKTIYLPLGIDTDFFRPMPEDTELKCSLGLSDSDFVILSVANLVPVKGIEILFEALLKLNDPSIKVLIVGADHSQYATELKSKYSNPQIIFLGKQMDVRPYLSLADVFVIPTKDEGRKEGLPIAPLEAMACGVPVIGSDISGIKDILEDYKELLFPANSVDVIADKILYIQNLNLDAIQNLKNKSVATVKASFSIEKFIDQQSFIYKEMID